MNYNKEKKQQYYQDNKERIQQYYQDNKEEILKKILKNYHDNKEEKLEYQHNYANNNKEKISLQKKEYRKRMLDSKKFYCEKCDHNFPSNYKLKNHLKTKKHLE